MGLGCRPRALFPEGRSLWQVHCSRIGRDREEGGLGMQMAQLRRVLRVKNQPHHSLVLHFTSKSLVRNGKLDLELGSRGTVWGESLKLNSKARIKPRVLQQLNRVSTGVLLLLGVTKRTVSMCSYRHVYLNIHTSRTMESSSSDKQNMTWS